MASRQRLPRLGRTRCLDTASHGPWARICPGGLHGEEKSQLLYPTATTTADESLDTKTAQDRLAQGSKHIHRTLSSSIISSRLESHHSPATMRRLSASPIWIANYTTCAGRVDRGLRRQRRSLQTAAELSTATDSLNVPTDSLKKGEVRTQLRQWESELGKERARVQHLADTAMKDSDGWIADNVRRYLAPTSFPESGELPPNFYGERAPVSPQSTPFRRVGDLLVGTESGFPVCAVLVCRLETRNDLYFRTNGKLLIEPPAKAGVLVFPSYFKPHDILPLLPHLPHRPTEFHLNEFDTCELPSAVGTNLRQHLSRLEQQIQHAYHAHAERIDSAWDLVAKPEHDTFLSIESFAETVFQKPRGTLSTAQIAALFCYGNTRNSLLTGVTLGESPVLPTKFDAAMYVGSRKHDQLVRKIEGWYAEYRAGARSDSSPITKFARWARGIIAHSRKSRAALLGGTLGPCGRTPRILDPTEKALADIGASADAETPNFEPPNEDCREILEYLRWNRDFYTRNLFTESHIVHLNFVPALARETGMYGDVDIDPGMREVFCRELGLLTPWRSASEGLWSTWPNNYASAEPQSAVMATFSATKDGASDPLRALRRDWSSTEIFCIDGPQTELLDDGISLEAIPNDPDSYWIHVHVANPTESIDPQHELVKTALGRAVSVYFSSHFGRLFPNEVNERYSLQHARSVLTFSARVNRAGQILDRAVTPGTIRGVTRVSPWSIDRFLNPSGYDRYHLKSYVVGDRDRFEEAREKAAGDVHEFTDGQKSTLRTLASLLTALRAERSKHSLLTKHTKFINSRVTVFDMRDWAQPQQMLHHFPNDPTIVLDTTLENLPGDSEKDAPIKGKQIVEVLMQLAGEVAGRYCYERNIPVPYFVMEPDPSLPPMEPYHRGFLESFPQDRPDVRNLASLFVAFRMNNSVSRKIVPGTNYTGIDLLVQITSPLRRSLDFLAHLQITRSLQLEASAGGGKIKFADNDARLAFDHSKVEKYLPTATRHMKYWAAMEQSEQRAWFREFLTRAIRFGEDPTFPEEVEVLIRQPNTPGRSTAMINIPSLGREGVMRGWPAEPAAPRYGYRTGERWLARFDPPNLALRPVARLGREHMDGFRPDEAASASL